MGSPCECGIETPGMKVDRADVSYPSIMNDEYGIHRYKYKVIKDKITILIQEKNSKLDRNLKLGPLYILPGALSLERSWFN